MNLYLIKEKEKVEAMLLDAITVYISPGKCAFAPGQALEGVFGWNSDQSCLD